MKVSRQVALVTGMIKRALDVISSDMSAAASNDVKEREWPSVACQSARVSLNDALELLACIAEDSLKAEERMSKRLAPGEDIFEDEEKPTGREYDSHGNLKLRPEL